MLKAATHGVFAVAYRSQGPMAFEVEPLEPALPPVPEPPPEPVAPPVETLPPEPVVPPVEAPPPEPLLPLVPPL
jgi:hypothetical protein